MKIFGGLVTLQQFYTFVQRKKLLWTESSYNFKQSKILLPFLNYVIFIFRICILFWLNANRNNNNKAIENLENNEN